MFSQCTVQCTQCSDIVLAPVYGCRVVYSLVYNRFSDITTVHDVRESSLGRYWTVSTASVAVLSICVFVFPSWTFRPKSEINCTNLNNLRAELAVMVTSSLTILVMFAAGLSVNLGQVPKLVSFAIVIQLLVEYYPCI